MNYEIINKGPFKNGRVLAPDSHFTGEEPTWESCSEWSKEKFLNTREKAIRFYNYYLSPSDLKPSLLEWMNQNGYDKKAIESIQNAPNHVPNSTVSKLARCILKGMLGKNEVAEIDDTKYIHDNVKKALNEISLGIHASKSIVKAKNPEVPVANPAERLRQKVMATIVGDLDQMLDRWIVARDKTVEPLKLYDVMDTYETALQGCSYVSQWLDKHLKEMEEALEGKDEQLVEAYSYLSKKALRSRIDALKSMKDDVIKYSSAKKSQRAPRKKRIKPAEKQVTNMKYLNASKDYNISSISPVLIPGSHRVYVFNVKYKALACYIADSPAGLSVKGTTIKGYNPSESFVQSLRKPDVILPMVLSKTPLQLEKILNELTTKRKTPNGRINEDTIILRQAKA